MRRFDLHTPLTTITTAPPATTRLTTASLDFTATEPGSTFQCARHIGFEVCISPMHALDLKAGEHTSKCAPSMLH